MPEITAKVGERAAGQDGPADDGVQEGPQAGRPADDGRGRGRVPQEGDQVVAGRAERHRRAGWAASSPPTGRPRRWSSLNCNTDFTAKSEPFLKLATKAAQQYLHHPDADIGQAGAVNADAAEVSQQTGENVVVGKSAYLKAPAGGTAAPVPVRHHGQDRRRDGLHRQAVGRLGDQAARRAHRLRPPGRPDAGLGPGRPGGQGAGASPSRPPRRPASRSRSPRRSPRAS